ncbi:MAG: MerR family transcriptional regulator [Deltaproteobacteria bacterium]|nr:MerR family transcriptional regulator [Deltaproteobacteria bacterium]
MDPIAPWTLDELSARVGAALGSVEVGQSNGQVTEVPNGRTIRYYATLGLIDRPYTAGRAVRYGRRHLVQLVAIKRLQARGLPLTEVAQQLGALDERALEALAALPPDDEIAALAAEVHGPAPKIETRRDRSFWSAEPAVPGLPQQRPLSPPSTEAVAPVAGITLSGGVTLSFPAARPLGDDDIEALRAALGPVVDVLRARGLITSPEGDER